MDENLATEVLREMKAQSRRYFIVLIITFILLVISNIIWAYLWNTNNNITSYDLQGQDSANVVYNDLGEVTISGENKNN